MDNVLIDTIMSMSDDDFSTALESLSEDEIDYVCDALEGISLADKRSIKSLGKGIGAGVIKTSPEQDRNHEAVYNAAMNKINSYQGKDREKALKMLRKGVKRGIGGNIFTRGKRADAAIANMKSSINYHNAQDKTAQLNQQLQSKIDAFDGSKNTNNKPVKENATMFDYDIETIEALEGIIADLSEMTDAEIDAVTESLDIDTIDVINQYISDRDDAIAVESIIDALVDMDDEEYSSAIESFDPSEIEYLSACESLVDTIRKVQFKGAGALVGADKAGDRMSDLKSAYRAGVTHGRATDKNGLLRYFGTDKTDAAGHQAIKAARDSSAATKERLSKSDKLGNALYNIGDSLGRSKQNRKDGVDNIKSGLKNIGAGIAGGAKKAARTTAEVLNTPIAYLPGEKKRRSKKLKESFGMYDN